MKSVLIYLKIISFYTFLPGFTLISWYSQQQKGPHGGTLKRAGNYYIEVKTADKFLYTYLLDTKLKSVAPKGLSCSARFFLRDSSIFNLGLKPFSENAYIGENIPEFYKCTVTFNTPHTSVSATFEDKKF